MQIKAGSLYSFKHQREFAVLKVLLVESGALHVRLFQERFAQRPTAIEPQNLKIARSHAPLSEAEFRQSSPVHLTNGIVTDEELAVYRIWRGR